ncbi:MAG: hypothetical protein ACLT0Y_06630 [Christensenellales bacterium]
MFLWAALPAAASVTATKVYSKKKT